MSDQLAIVYRSSEFHKVHLLQTVLADYQIACRVTEGPATDETVQIAQVYVHERDLELAARIVESFERHILTGEQDFGESPEDELEEFEAPHVWVQWPSCESCQSVRDTSCPFCETVSSNFELAYQDEPEEGSLESDTSGDNLSGNEASEGQGPELTTDWPLLICHTCSEPFEPQFFRHCAHCGHDFGHGLLASDVELAPNVGFASPATFGWMLIVIAILLLLFMSST